MPLDRTVGNYFDKTAAHLTRIGRWKGPNPYVTGGEDVSPGVFGLGKVICIPSAGAATDNLGNVRLVTWNPTTQKLQWFVASTGLEVANGTDLSAFTISLTVYGN